MPSHAETIQHAEQAITACETTIGYVQTAANELATVGNHVRAAFDGTDYAPTLGQLHEAASGGIGGAGQAVQQLMTELSAALARFQG